MGERYQNTWHTCLKIPGWKHLSVYRSIFFKNEIKLTKVKTERFLYPDIKSPHGHSNANQAELK